MRADTTDPFTGADGDVDIDPGVSAPRGRAAPRNEPPLRPRGSSVRRAPPYRTPPSLTVIVPAFNEGLGLAPSVERLRAALAPLVDGGQLSGACIVIVDDGSTDDTAEVAEQLAHGDPSTRVVRHPKNRGLGAGIRTGIDQADSDLILYCDADLPIAPTALGPALELLHDHRPVLVNGNRVGPRRNGCKRRLYTYAYRRLVLVALSLRVLDVNCGFKLLPLDMARALRLKSEGSFIDAELLARADRRGVVIKELGCRAQPRLAGESSLASTRVILGIFREYWDLRHEIRQAR